MTVKGIDIEQSEREIAGAMRIAGDIAPGLLYDKAGVDLAACDAYIAHQMTTLMKHLPDLSVRIEGPVIATMMRHAFIVGVTTGRRDAGVVD